MDIQNNVNNVSGTGGSVATPTAGNGGGDVSAMFTRLLVAQVKNQDPLAPMEANQFVTQFAQMSQVEAMQTLANLSAANARTQESMLVVTLGSQVGSQVRVRSEKVELGDAGVKGGFKLESSASEVGVILTDGGGTEYKVPLGAKQAGDVDFNIDPAEHGLPPGKYTLRVVADSGEKPPVELDGNLQSVRLGTDGRVILTIAGMGDAAATDITRFLGRSNQQPMSSETASPQSLPISKRFQS
ncbi:flagellar hook assembly protein FlgD [Burkholderia sp. AU42008]|uniref:flagellar hook capping FlgD N-terminal domain-containing protein n=1 Tax=unclassified Burkholderia TaxID=2613784 RepID=UPI000B7ADA37|nr:MULTISPECIES: flagellar hook capping FlgD N-terminal domain-containing protein [unclassified Burkholderia]MBR8238330.1 flagellar hook assembly protein FlgD [Burkholderia sp. AU32357]MBY4877513.1 flagellar hook assembly protein FlgD [Burkholderia sp. AU42008]OXI37415.1 flagellar biosynthesis protein FlgD [Burkholderia sp. AU17457]